MSHTVFVRRASIAFLLVMMSLGACGCLGSPSSSPPMRTSPTMTAAEALPGVTSGVASTHEAWSSASALVSIVHDADETITRTASMAIQTFELARDGTMIACASDGSIVVVDASGQSRTEPATLVDGVLGCRDVTIAAHDDAWVMLAPMGLGSPPAGAICHLGASATRCTSFDGPAAPRTLVLTAEHVWWVAMPAHGVGAQLLALDRTMPAAMPVVVLDAFDATVSLYASPATESVIAVPSRSASDQSVRRITSDGGTSTLVASSESGAYADVWITADDRVLALDVLTGGTPHCSSGVLGYGGGCGASIDWTQLVVWELGASAPRELAHVSYDGGGQSAIGIERTTGTFVAGDRWYALP